KFWYSSRNASVYGGCHNTSTNKCVDSASWCGCNTADDTNCTWRNQWTELDVASQEYEACANLTYGGTPVTRPRFYLFAKVFVPADTPSKVRSNATLTFTARTPG
ncbi:MAG: hypothetical protein V1735_03960, partial [Nanoarchaeota archaeon]